MEHVSRREFLQYAASAAGATLLVSRAGTSARGRTASDKTLNFLDWQATDGPIGDAISAFEKKNKAHVNVQISASGSIYETKLRTVFASGSPPDVVRINDDLVRSWSDQGQLQDLRKFIKKDINPNDYFASAYKYPIRPDGSHPAWVIGSAPTLIFYNVDAFKEANLPLPPTTWTSKGWMLSDFLHAAQKLTSSGKWGALLYDDTGAESIYPVEFGDPDGIYSKNTKKFLLGTAKAAEGLQWVADLSTKYRVQPPWSMLQARTNANFDNDFFVSGRVAMIERHLTTIPYFQENIKDFHWDVAPIPAHKTQVSKNALVVYAISKSSKKHDLAWQLLKELSSKESGTRIAGTGAFVPINKQAAEALGKVSPPPQHVNLFADAVAHGLMENAGDNVNQARNIYRPAMDQAFAGQGSVSSQLQGVTDQVNAVLGGAAG